MQRFTIRSRDLQIFKVGYAELSGTRDVCARVDWDVARVYQFTTLAR